MTLVSILKRAGTFQLGMFFWWMMFVLVLEVLMVGLALGTWLFPQWEIFESWTFLVTPAGWSDHLLHGLLWFLTAAIGWFYVFRHKYKPLWILVCVWGVLMAVNFPFSLASTKLPTDEELIENFKRNEAAFQRLAEMALEDRNLESASSPRALQEHGEKSFPFYPVDSVSEERKAEYSRLLEQTGVLSLMRPHFRYYKVEITLPVVGDDKFGRFVVKGYAYSTDDRLPVVQSLDQLPRGAQRTYFRKVSGNWYLSYFFSY